MGRGKDEDEKIVCGGEIRSPGLSHLIQLVTVSCQGALIDRDRLGESKARLL